jgi:hypothetical protein
MAFCMKKGGDHPPGRISISWLMAGGPTGTCLRAVTHRQVWGLPVRRTQTGLHKATRSTWRLSTGYRTLQRIFFMTSWFSMNEMTRISPWHPSTGSGQAWGR